MSSAATDDSRAGNGRHVLITGGAGFLGINLARHLLRHGFEVISLDLEPFNYADCRDQVNVHTGDIRNREQVDAAMASATDVVHTAAALPLYSEQDILTTDIDGSQTIMEAAAARGIKRVVHISSTAVYGIPDHHPLKEDDALHGVGPYGIAKVKAEEICASYRDQGMCVPILRPKSFVGPERLGVFALLYDWAKDGRGFPMIGSGHNRYQLLDVEDLCDSIRLSLLGDADQVSDTFNIGAKEFTTMKEDYQAVLDRAGFGKKVRGFPAAPLIWTLRVLEALKLSPLYKWVYETASKDSFVSIDKAERVLGYSPRYSNKQALVRNYEWYIDHLHQFESQAGVSHRVPWSQGILSVAKRFF